jgi:hypothetical protein
MLFQCTGFYIDEMLEFNKLVNDWNLEIVHSAFDPTILGRREVELAEFDCEGCERALLDLSTSDVHFDMVGEIHGVAILEEGEEQGYRQTIPLASLLLPSSLAAVSRSSMPGWRFSLASSKISLAGP